MAVRDVKSTIEVPRTIIEREEVTFWAFQMREHESLRGTRTYFMVTLEDPRGVLLVQFHREREEALYAIRRNNLVAGSLYMTWSLFERVARRALDNEGQRVSIPGHGSFRHEGQFIRYTTACQMSYFITPDELEGLLA